MIELCHRVECAVQTLSMPQQFQRHQAPISRADKQSSFNLSARLHGRLLKSECLQLPGTATVIGDARAFPGSGPGLQSTKSAWLGK